MLAIGPQGVPQISPIPGPRLCASWSAISERLERPWLHPNKRRPACGGGRSAPAELQTGRLLVASRRRRGGGNIEDFILDIPGREPAACSCRKIVGPSRTRAALDQ